MLPQLAGLFGAWVLRALAGAGSFRWGGRLLGLCPAAWRPPVPGAVPGPLV
jgi:hypothetical protein